MKKDIVHEAFVEGRSSTGQYSGPAWSKSGAKQDSERLQAVLDAAIEIRDRFAVSNLEFEDKTDERFIFRLAQALENLQ